VTTEVATRQFDVKVFYAHCRGDSFVEAKDSGITFARAYTINGIYVSEDWAELHFEPWGVMVLKEPDEDRSQHLVGPYREFLESLTADEYLEEPSSDKGITIPVSRFEFIEGNWFDCKEE